MRILSSLAATGIKRFHNLLAVLEKRLPPGPQYDAFMVIMLRKFPKLVAT
jgi:hypothetical protein